MKIYASQEWVEDKIAERVLKRPDWNQNDSEASNYIKNRPFYTENGLVVVQEETTIILNENGTGYYDGSWYPDADVIYTVIWDGVEYISEPGYMDSEACYRFNVTIDGERVNFYEGNTIYGTPAMAGEHVFKIFKIQETIHKVDLKYLPDIPTKMDRKNAVCELSFSMSSSTASASFSHAIGKNTTASGYGSHAEGHSTVASSNYSHAEGWGTTASGDSSHAEGSHTTASGDFSHAEGEGTVAQRGYQHVQGRYNILDTDGLSSKRGKYAHIVGNGTSDTKLSNAHTLDWEGNAWYQGDIFVGGTGQDDTAAKKLATEEYVANLVGEAPTFDLSAIRELPAYDPIADEGKILKIVNGVPTWVSIPNAEGASF